MTLSISLAIAVVGVALIIVSAFLPALVIGNPDKPRSVSLWNLGWGLVLAGVLLGRSRA